MPIPADLPVIPPGKPLLVVMSAPSGAGKDAVRELMRDWGFPAHFVVTATTRPQSLKEVHGRDYFFVDEAEFARMEHNDELIEHATVYGRRYGVPRDEVLKPLQAGENVVARVDVQGAETLKRLVPDALLIFIAPPSLEEASIRRRLRWRPQETSTTSSSTRPGSSKRQHGASSRSSQQRRRSGAEPLSTLLAMRLQLCLQAVPRCRRLTL